MPFIQKVSLLIICTFLVIAPGCKSDTRSKGSASSSSIKNSDIDFPGMQLRPGSDKESFTLVGRIRNKSAQQTIAQVKLRLTMEDVLVSGASTTVGETFLTLQQEVPPGDSKSFSENILFKKFPLPKGRHEWNYSIAEIKAKE